MKVSPYLWLYVLCFVAAAVLHQAVSFRMVILGARPDFFLVMMSVLTADVPRRSGLWIGFWAGFLTGALDGADLGHYVLSRLVAALVIGFVAMLDFKTGWASIFFSAVIITLVAQVTLMFLAPPAGIVGFLGATILMAMYNGVLAMAVYALLRRILPTSGR